METAIEHTLSDVLREPNPVLREAERQDVLIRRRGQARDMVLTDAGRARALRETLGTLARLLGTAAQKGIVLLLTEDVHRSLPWTLHLPDEERQQFVTELTEMAGASADTANFTPLAMLLRDWQATALAYADPAAYAELTQPLEETNLPSLLDEGHRLPSGEVATSGSTRGRQSSSGIYGTAVQKRGATSGKRAAKKPVPLPATKKKGTARKVSGEKRAMS